MCKIICLGDGGTYGYIKFSVSYLFNARNVTFRTNFFSKRYCNRKSNLMDNKNTKRALPL